MANIPAVSVIIPMYNMEKYIGECLDSVLAQTFDDYEVIVVDDCSTDNSLAIVKNYFEKFGGRLQIASMKKNSGGAGFPRNKGVKIARGEYVYFLDPDDTITSTALEELYTLAKKFDTDVVQCEKCYYIPDKLWNDPVYRKNPRIYTYPAGDKIFVTEPIFLSDNFEQRILNYRTRWLTWSVYLQLIKRDFILENEIEFGDFYCEDQIFTLCEISCAKKYLVVPNVVYNYRSERQDSSVNERIDFTKDFHKRMAAMKKGIAYLDKFLNGIEFYSNRSDLRYILFEFFALDQLNYFAGKFYSQLPAHALDKLLRKEFAEGDNNALMAFVFGMMNVQRLQLIQAQQNFNRFALQSQNRIKELEAQLKAK